jgi:N-acetylglucosamine-6-phosphate deacetylase
MAQQGNRNQMTSEALCGAQLLVAGSWRGDHALLLEDELIAGLCPVSDVPARTMTIQLEGGFLLPGFIDCQVNGGGGVLLNDAPTVEGIAAIAAAHRRFGTTGLLPTLISDDLSVVAAALLAVDAAICAGVPGILGIHVEGPFLNERKRGIHDSTKLRPLDGNAVELLSSLKHGKTLVTLAPELTDDATISALVARGVIVAAGHSLATYERMQTAFAAGLSGVTHLYNAMTQLDSRAPGVVGATLDHPSCFAGLIADGHHVHAASMRLAYKTMGPGRLMLVTDAMPSVGAATKTFNLGDTLITVADGICRGPDGTLAGSDLDMGSALRNAMRMIKIDLATASIMASAAPAAFLGQSAQRGRLRAGLRADIVHLDQAYNVQNTWINGKREHVA